MPLIQVNDVYIDPSRVINVWPISCDEFAYSINWNNCVAIHRVEVEEGGWDVDRFAEYVNEYL